MASIYGSIMNPVQGFSLRQRNAVCLLAAAPDNFDKLVNGAKFALVEFYGG
jgi:hypothetical protein